MKTFWDKYPIIGLAPMDGVTDAAFRYISDTIGKPDLLLTEFVSVEGITAGAIALLDAFIYHKTKTPTIAQIYGTEPEAFYQSAFIVCELGFDGIDINMGCPDKSVSGRGAGAGLIRNPERAKAIVKATKQAALDWSEGKKLGDVGLRPKVTNAVRKLQKQLDITPIRRLLPVSVKTRIGFDRPVIHEWISHLLETEPVNITIHGRTLKQMYTGLADWDEIGAAAQLAKGSSTTIMGNGDVKSMDDAGKRIKEYGLHGVLIGRATFGNPWLFKREIPSTDMRLRAALAHCEAFERMLPKGHFLSLRKHMAWYCKGFDGAAEIRARLMSIQSVADVRQIVQPLFSKNQN